LLFLALFKLQEVDEENLEETPEVAKAPTKKSANSEIDINRKFDEFKKIRDIRYSKSENDSPSPNELSPTKDPTAGKNHPLESNDNQNNKVSGGVATPGKIVQRPSL
jgi:hypothetical protein